MKTHDTDSSRVSTVRTAFDIVDAIQELEGASITELADHLEIAKSTVHRHVKTLEQELYVVERNGVFDLGLQFLNHGIYARDRQPFYQATREKVEKIAAVTGELSTFIVRERHLGFLLCRVKGHKAVETGDWIGKPVFLHATAGGKCILAHSDESEVESVLEQIGLPRRTAKTITEAEALYEELAKVRENGYAINQEEHIDGLNAVAVPISGGNQRILGALVVSGPTNRVNGTRLKHELPDLLLGASNELELNLTYS